MLGEVLKALEGHQNFVLTSHARPDGDAIGSVLACSQILRAMGKTTEVVLSDRVPVLYQPLPFADKVVQASEVNGRYEAAVILECDSLARTRLRGLERHFLVNIDHHASGKPFANVNWIDPTACATAELIYQVAKQAQIQITPEIATCLYAAVLTDTGSFCYSNTSSRTFALAQELVQKGADPVRIAHGIYFARPFSKTLLLGAALRSLQRCNDLAWMHVTWSDMERCHATEEDCEGLVNFALANSGIEVAAFFRELESRRWRVSLRSKGAVNVAAIAETMGGGGHECAAGCSVEGPLEVATAKILAQLECALKRSAHKQ